MADAGSNMGKAAGANRFDAPADRAGMARAARRVTSGIEAVFLGNQDALLRFFRARGRTDQAEDLLQELWLQASSVAAAPVSDPEAYLYRMANNLMLGRSRSDHRRRRREQDWTEVSTAGGELASDVESGERILVARQQVQAIETALSGLGEKTGTIFRRFRLEGIRQEEIAREFGISLSAVEKHLQKAYRALLELRDELDAD
jgi:RNA polymerase sigma-70 factor (ECF subfamily)